MHSPQLLSCMLISFALGTIAALPTDKLTLAPQISRRDLTQESRDNHLVAITALVGFLVGIKVSKFLFNSIKFCIDAFT
ncbi:hypothetical protein BX661DRAFT_190398 [Kickxella alabastrina]|uniref:uncharacterized protein n=1 Tax=Kickxella alabastrina TaxID=61397 RepID=UPI0022200215|nr:uncharacterized protein BX661DRAFT_190398 [Kickxella alabastrina]KAI7819455.1 hypothetical protein BX661DRAFT_190398 [Kickxella alabastrina]